MKITMLGTGNASVGACYNTCFVMEDGGRKLLVDGGGGRTLFNQLEKAGIDYREIHEVYLTHHHLDHIIGLLWFLRYVGQLMAAGKYEGTVTVYGHAEVLEKLETIGRMLIDGKAAKAIGDTIRLVTVADGERGELLGHPVTFFDIQSKKAPQFGFAMEYEPGHRLVCLGDESYNPVEESYVREADWVMMEAFCLYGERDIFKPYEKKHSTVKEACELAEEMKVKNLILYHTEDKNILRRKELYTAEGREYFHGNLVVPDDLEVIDL